MVAASRTEMVRSSHGWTGRARCPAINVRASSSLRRLYVDGALTRLDPSDLGHHTLRVCHRLNVEVLPTVGPCYGLSSGAGGKFGQGGECIAKSGDLRPGGSVRPPRGSGVLHPVQEEGMCPSPRRPRKRIACPVLWDSKVAGINQVSIGRKARVARGSVGWSQGSRGP